ncbi:hypothetical protein [Desulfosarcina widdelii]|nr:hypothetical protein [Desulfosarcina widdelii]
MIAFLNPTCRRMIGLMTLMALFTGCASIFQNLDDKMSRQRFKKDYEALDAALEIYDQGDFEKALARFRTIKSDRKNEKIERRAWLGEICCCLLLADTPAEFSVAIGMWHAFADSTADADATWSQALLDPLVVRLASQASSGEVEVDSSAEPPEAATGTKTPTMQEKADQPQNEEDRLEAEMAELRKKAKRADKLQLKIAKILAENRSLKEKIKALEAIDQSIQKKKSEISTSGE